jgi:flagellar basal-body rod modification protein FlgD
MSIMSSILQHAQAGQALKPAAALPQSSAAGGSGNSTSSSATASSTSATISANDFLTLLVTEMQNQDPTAQTDPNEYINQLVSVNSLEQLIDINQTLSTATSSTSSTSSSGSSAKPGITTSSSPIPAVNSQPAATNGNQPNAAASLPSQTGTSTTATTPHAAGNLTFPDASPAALRVAHALSGQTRSPQSTNTTIYSAR